METDQSDAWVLCREASSALAELSRRISKATDLLLESTQLGNVGALEIARNKLLEEVEGLSAAVQRFQAPARTTQAELAIRIESLARSSSTLGDVIRRDNRLLVGSTGIRVEQMNTGDLVVVVGSETLRTSSADAVLKEIAKQAKDKFDHKRLIKALKDSFKFLVAIRDVNEETAVIPLEDVRKLINISRDGTAYSVEHLTDDIQRLVCSFHTDMVEAGIEFVPVPAARIQFEFIEETGNITHLGGLRIKQRVRVEP